MSNLYRKSNGLVFSEDGKTLIEIDSESSEFTGKIPYGIQFISADAFAGSSVKEILLPDSVKELPDALFENLKTLESVKLPENLAELPPYLFSGCSSLKKVRLPVVITHLSEGLFYNCESLEEITLREGIQELPENVFAGCASLKSLIIPSSVYKIGKDAFKDCKNLEVVLIPAKLYELEDGAFDGCDAIRTIRVDPENHLFYIDEDGNLYEKNINPDEDDLLRIKIVEKTEDEKSFLQEVPDSENIGGLDFVSSEDLEADDTFSAEIGADDEEILSVQNNESEDAMSEENTNEVDSIFADIMNDEKQRTAGAEDVAISEAEGKVLSHTMEVMAEAAPATNAAVSNEELENLFASHEASVNADNAAGEEKSEDNKVQILINSVEFSKVIENAEVEKSSREDSNLYVIAEKLIENDDGSKAFSEKLLKCVQKIAFIQDFKKIILLNGLPIDNDEFMQFYYHFISMKNVILACTADSAADLSDYCKKICEKSRISLEKDDLAEQRRSISIKNDLLIKLVIKDIYQ